jgi:hypothetical protein
MHQGNLAPMHSAMCLANDFGRLAVYVNHTISVGNFMLVK